MPVDVALHSDGLMGGRRLLRYLMLIQGILHR